jgi:hypothetical protein
MLCLLRSGLTMTPGLSRALRRVGCQDPVTVQELW